MGSASSSDWLLELELGRDRAAVLRRHGDQIAAARPAFRGLPVLDELSARGVVAEACAARRRELDVVGDKPARAGQPLGGEAADDRGVGELSGAAARKLSAPPLTIWLILRPRSMATDSLGRSHERQNTTGHAERTNDTSPTELPARVERRATPARQTVHHVAESPKPFGRLDPWRDVALENARFSSTFPAAMLIGRLLADLIPDARYIDVAGEDHFAWIMPTWREIDDTLIEFATGVPVGRTSTRRSATVLFTDIVGSTRQSAERGDAAWQALLDSHDRIARRLVDQHSGRVVKSTGAGLLVTFDSPSQGVACGVGLRDALAGIGIEIRAGVHAGEIEVHDDGDISGIAVNLAARVEQRAADGEFWASPTVRDMMLGGSTTFADVGEHELKGIDGSWRLFSVAL